MKSPGSSSRSGDIGAAGTSGTGRVSELDVTPWPPPFPAVQGGWVPLELHNTSGSVNPFLASEAD